ncbi:hypothetical protein AQUCO_04900024v1 [Aquilegia coerulea]|uniref:Uncharacterized protein n=1 Tax=Aquilegia coerulea TaxID=218851 RepID=A0A2G5CJH5_AQUCA|nr:hypothetical protein AQUCO_04900024v1 [Aquilegia coerulea]
MHYSGQRESKNLNQTAKHGDTEAARLAFFASLPLNADPLLPQLSIFSKTQSQITIREYSSTYKTELIHGPSKRSF